MSFKSIRQLMVVIFPLKAIFKPFRFEGSSKLVLSFQMPLEFNLFICLVCKWDIVAIRIGISFLKLWFSIPLVAIRAMWLVSDIPRTVAPPTLHHCLAVFHSLVFISVQKLARYGIEFVTCWPLVLAWSSLQRSNVMSFRVAGGICFRAYGRRSLSLPIFIYFLLGGGGGNQI